MDVGDVRYRPETGCAAQADRRHDALTATAPPAERWLLIESRSAWPRQALTSLRNSSSGAELGDVIAQRCRELKTRPVLIRRYGRIDQTAPRRWALVDCRPGRELIRWGDLPTDEHLLQVLAGNDSGLMSNEPVYLVCTHGRHDACCAVRGRPVAATLTAAYPERTWECSHIGGDRFAANVVVLPHGLFYGQVAAARAVELAEQYDEGSVVPDLLRGSGAFVPPVQAAQHFARAAGHSPAVDNLLPHAVEVLGEHRWRILLASTNGLIAVEVSARLATVDARLTCAGSSPAQIRHFELHSLTAA
ncbi:sucrase ferredoxin [Kribbella sp. C-35]|uniref:sucrase ferredoxin n=1 Tax=Kribbella sp. C-35 TaxID=2789276 RepID=UPI003979CF49